MSHRGHNSEAYAGDDDDGRCKNDCPFCGATVYLSNHIPNCPEVHDD